MKIKITESQFNLLINGLNNSLNESEMSDPLISDIAPRVKKHEGYEELPYMDSVGKLTVGYGFNLTRSDAKDRLKEVGADYHKVVSKKQKLNSKQMEKLLLKDLNSSKENAQKIISNFNTLPKDVQGVIVEMIFNLGIGKFRQFKNFIKLIKERNFKKASVEMMNSLWAKQVGDRAKTLSNIIKNSKDDNLSLKTEPEKEITPASTTLVKPTIIPFEKLPK